MLPCNNGKSRHKAEGEDRWVFLVDFYCYFFRFMYIHFHPLYNNDSIKEYTHIQHDIFYVSSDPKLQKWEFIFYQALLLWQTSNVSHTERSPGLDKKAQGYLHEKWATQVHRITTTADSSLYISALNGTVHVSTLNLSPIPPFTYHVLCISHPKVEFTIVPLYFFVQSHQPPKFCMHIYSCVM